MCDTAARPKRAPGVPQPRWSMLYGFGFLMLGAVLMVEIAPLPAAWQTALGCGLGFAGFATLAGWVRRNRVALEQEDWCDCAAAKMTVRELPSPVSGATLAPWVSNGQTAIHRWPASPKRQRAGAAAS